VPTCSRPETGNLRRPAKEKLFILDFLQRAADILDAFLPYLTQGRADRCDRTADALANDLQKNRWMQKGIYYWQRCEAFGPCAPFFDPKAAARGKLSYYCTPGQGSVFAKRL